MLDATARLSIEALKEERLKAETEILNGASTWERYRELIGRRKGLADAEKIVVDRAKKALED
jgi:hypothetical protein